MVEKFYGFADRSVIVKLFSEIACGIACGIAFGYTSLTSNRENFSGELQFNFAYCKSLHLKRFAINVRYSNHILQYLDMLYNVRLRYQIINWDLPWSY